MDKRNYIVVIDLGSGNVTAAAGSKAPDGKLNVIDLVSEPMLGMSSGEVINIEQVTTAVRTAVDKLEEHLGIKITEAYAGISGHDIQCADSSYYVYVSGEDHEICEEDVTKLHESMANLQPPEGICILGRTPQKYVIDSREETMQPVGRFGQQLEATFNFVLANRSSLERLGKAFSRLGIERRRIFTNAQASAEAVLTDDEKELGAAVVDIGAGCTDICIWQDNIMRYIGTLPIGSDAINRDIRSIAIPERFIEKLKTTYGYAMASALPEDRKMQSIKIKGRTQRETKEISIFNLTQIIEARMLDIVENVIDEIKESGYSDKLGSGIVLTGGGAHLKGIDSLFRERTKYDVRIGGPCRDWLNVASQNMADNLQASSAVGLLLLGIEESNIEATDSPIAKPEQRNEKATQTKDKYNEIPAAHDNHGTQHTKPDKPQWHNRYDDEDTDINSPGNIPETETPANNEPEQNSGKKRGSWWGKLIDNVKTTLKDSFDVVDDDKI